MKYLKNINKVKIDPDDTICHLAQVTHSTVNEWIIFLESMINEELKEFGTLDERIEE